LYKKQSICKVERILQEKNVTALRLLPYYCDVNLIEITRNVLKQEVVGRNAASVSLTVSENMTRQTLGKITHEGCLKVEILRRQLTTNTNT
jgi:hypothetical protein